jgi:hypothetical protein
MPEPTKFQIGETAEATGEGRGLDFVKANHEGRKVIILGTRNKLADYSDYLSNRQETLYLTYCVEYDLLWWYGEEDIRKYCINTEKGKKILMKIDDLEGKLDEKCCIQGDGFIKYIQDCLIH